MQQLMIDPHQTLEGNLYLSDRNAEKGGERPSFCGIVLAIVAFLIGAAGASGQSYIPPIVPTASTTLYTSSSVISPGRVAVDRAGNVFYVATGSSSTLMEIPAASQTGTNGAPVTLVTGLGQYNSKAVVVDVNGNLWVTTGNQEQASPSDYVSLVEIPAANGIPNTALIASGGVSLGTADAAHCTSTGTALCTVLNYKLNDSGNVINGPQAMDFWIDGSGNIYYIDVGDNNLPSGVSRIVKSSLYNGGGTILGSTSSSTYGSRDYSATVAVDGAGNTYYCSPTAGMVYLVGGGTFTAVGSTATITSALISSPAGVSNDGYGNLFISSGSQISEVPFESTALNFSDEFGIAGGLSTSVSGGGAFDQNGNFYYASNGSSSTKVQQLQINGYNFGSVAIGSTVSSSSTPAAPSLALYDNVAQSGGVSSYFPTGSPTTNPTPLYLQSFPYSGTKSFLSSTPFVVGSTYTITMNFQPIHPGLLKGSFTPRAGGSDVAVINLQGTGAGPEPVFLPGAASQIFTTAGTKTINAPQGLAVDTYGDIFLADTGNGTVDADCLATTTQAEDGTNGNASNSFCSIPTTYSGLITALGTGFVSPVAIALDGAQSLYVVDSAPTGTPVTVINGQTLAATRLISSTTTFGGTALSSPRGIAVDGYTNIYVADTGNNRIVKAHQFGGTATDNIVYVPSTATFAGTKLNGPTGLAIDGAQNLYIADTGNNRVVEYSGTGATSVLSTGSITLNSPYAVAVYPSGQVIVTDQTNGVVLLNGSASSVLSFGTSFTTTGAKGVALDPTGNIYISNTGEDQVLELNVTSPQAITFPSTNAGAQSPGNTETVLNAGNAALTFSSLASGNTNFLVDASSTCTSTTPVASGSSCALVTKFSPQSTGPLSGSVTLTDNQLSYTTNNSTSNQTATFAASGTQALNLSGTGTSSGSPQTISFPAPASPIAYTTTPITLSATATSGLTVQFSVLSGPGTITGTQLTVTGVGTIVIAANQPGGSGYASAAQVTRSIVVNQAPQTITFTPTTPIAFAQPAPSVNLSATSTSGLAVTFTLNSGPATLSGSTLSITNYGTVVVTANQAGNTNYAAATPAQVSIVVNPIGTVPTPVLSAAAGTYNIYNLPSESISDSLSNATIYYTTDGSTPSPTGSTSKPYAGASSLFVIATSQTVKAAAFLFGYAPSAVATSSYTIDTTTEALQYSLTPTSLSLHPGQSGTINIVVTPQNGINATISFLCTGVPLGASCAFSPSSVATGPSQTSVSTVLTVTAPTTLGELHRSSNVVLATSGIAVALLLYGMRRRRRLRAILFLALAMVTFGSLSGCGSSSSSQTSTIVVSIAGDAVRYTPTFTLTVQ